MIRLAPGTLVRCTDTAGRTELKLGREYTIECEWGCIGSTHLVYLKDMPDVIPYRDSRFSLVGGFGERHR